MHMDDKVRILLAEDDTNLGFVIRDNLEQHGFQVDLYQNGQEALQHFEEANYQLCILDVMMPGKDGYSVAKYIRNQSTLDKTAILFLTAKGTPQDKMEGYGSGAESYIVKPFDNDEIVTRVQEVLQILF
mgnify:CR=1 FL=1